MEVRGKGTGLSSNILRKIRVNFFDCVLGLWLHSLAEINGPKVTVTDLMCKMKLLI